MKATIIGGGITGLTTALAFEKLGINYTLHEKAESLNEVGAGIWVSSNALQVFNWLGLANEIISKGVLLENVDVADSKFNLITRTNQKLLKEKLGFGTISIHRAVLQNILFDALPKQKIFFKQKAVEIISNPSPTVTFSNGNIVHSDFIIGADGIHSSVRKSLFPSVQIRPTNQMCWRGVSNYQLPEPFINSCLESWGNQLRFGFSVISHDRVYWFAVSSVDKDLKKNKQELIEAYKDFHPIVKNIISNTDGNNIIARPLGDLAPLDQWHKDQIILMGDAAHATTPNMGQGAAQGIEDAYYLSHLLLKHLDIKQSFEAFDKTRKARVNAIVKRSRMIGSLAHLKKGQPIRNTILRMIPNFVTDKQMLKTYKLRPLT